ncbi:uncharacterized protein LOC107855679 [Capsicum annuum]|uniref:uncharacterized protein LOC107855679 n=1 Tax=Capsicum annuum TaxID=4072 RepID=UPI001FB11A57|nr:uncharacterized protein LOC107855679 [Capsicum annuum]
MVVKKEDPGAFTISCTIGVYEFGKTLCDLGEIINFMPFTMFQKLGLGALKPTTMRLLMVDRSIKKPVGVLYDVLVKVDRFIFSSDFVTLDCEVDHEAPIFFGRPFVATERAIVDVEYGEIKFWVNTEEVFFNLLDDEVANTIEIDLMNDRVYCGTLEVRRLTNMMRS